MPKEIRDLITDNSLTGADEFESEADALLFGCRWYKTKNENAIIRYYHSILQK